MADNANYAPAYTTDVTMDAKEETMISDRLLCHTLVFLADAKDLLKRRVQSSYDMEILERLQYTKDELQKVIDYRRESGDN
jgi:precorrin isomerase